MTDLAAALQSAADRSARRRPGVVVGYLAPDRTSHVASAWHRDLPDARNLDADSLFEIGSITKVFTALLLAESVRRGEVALDTPLADLLPEVRVPSRDGKQVTLEHLATHRSGLPGSPVARRSLLRSVLVTHGNPFAHVTEPALLDALATTTLGRTPGSGTMSYSNFGASLLGLALARVAGEPYAALVESRICRPLGLTDTVITLDRDQADRFAPGHRGRRTPAAAWDLPGMAPAGALKSSARDVLAFLDANLHLDHPLGDAMRLTHEQRWRSGRQGIGLGWMQYPDPDATLHWHNGGTGGYRSFAGFVPGRGHAVVALTNCTRGVDGTAMVLLRDIERA